MCEKRNCGCNTPGNMMICYTKEPMQPCIGVNLTVNNTEIADGSDNTSMILEETNNISAFKDHLEFVNSPEPLSGLKRNVVLRLTTKFLTTIANIFRGRNIGTGASIYKGSVTELGETFQEFKRLRSTASVDFTDGPNEIIATVNEDWLQDQFPDVPTINYPVTNGESVGTGAPFYKGLSDKKIQVASLKSDNIIITEESDGSIKINTPGGGTSSSDWYLDPLFQRPSNWDALAESIDGIKTAKGTLNDPFKTYEEYLRRRIGETGGSNSIGPYSKANPKVTSVTLQILSNIETASDLEVQNTIIRLRNNAEIMYSGTRPYAFDYEELFDQTPVDISGVSKLQIKNEIRGEGRITRRTGFGIIRVKSTGPKTQGKGGGLHLEGEGSGLYIVEGENYNLYTKALNADGNPMSNGNSEVYCGQIPPTFPLIQVNGQPYQWWGLSLGGTKVFILTKSQKGIHLINSGSVTSSADKLMFQVSNTYFGYEKRLLATDTLTGEDLQLMNYFGYTGDTNLGVFYKPYDEYEIFSGETGTYFRIEKLATEPNGFHNFKANSIINVNNSIFSNLVSFEETGGGGAINLIKSSSSTSGILINNALLQTNYLNLVKGDGTNDVILYFVNSNATVKNIKTNVNSLNVITSGTISSINNFPIMSMLPEYADNIAALVDLVPGMLYRDITTKEVKQVI